MLGKKITFCKQNQQIAETSTHEAFPLEGGLWGGCLAWGCSALWRCLLIPPWTWLRGFLGWLLELGCVDWEEGCGKAER